MYLHAISNVQSQKSDVTSFDFLQTLFNNTYGKHIITPIQRMKRAKENDFWFTLHNSSDEIIASCSATRENDTIFEINDVYVEEQYRGNNYSGILLNHIIDYFHDNFKNDFNKKNTIKICCEHSNSAAYNSYKKIFTKYREDERMVYFVY